MNGLVLNVEEIEWRGVPIKYCEFKRACKDFIAMDRSDIEYIVMNVTLGCLSREDRTVIVRSMSPTLPECTGGSRGAKTEFLSNLIKLIVFRYKQHKMTAMRSQFTVADEYEVRAHQHYEALRCLKESLICGRSLLENDMPEVGAQ